MMFTINPTPLLPQLPAFVDQSTLAHFMTELWRALHTEFTRIAQRLNAVSPKNGSEPMAAPLPLQGFTVATVPSPSSWTGAMVYVSNGSSNRRIAISDGANWRFLDGSLLS